MAIDPLKVAVLGPGGVGGLLAALLARAGSPVVVLAGEETCRALDTRGLHVESVRFGDFTTPVRTALRLEEPVDACFITVKSTHLMEALKRVPVEAAGQGLVIPLLNGLDHISFLRSVYPAVNVVAATMRVEVARVRAGEIRHTSPFASIDLAAMAQNRYRVERVAALLKSVGLGAHVRDDETQMLWDKLVMLAPLALLTTHERANLGVVRTRRRDELAAAIHEVAAVARADGADIDAQGVVSMLDAAPESMESSMQRDQAEGRPLELDGIGSAVLWRAARFRIAVPVTTRLVEELRARNAQQARK